MDQIMNVLSMAGLPALIGVFVSGVVQKLKLNPSIPYIAEGETIVNRCAVVILCLIVQIVFDFIHHDPINSTIIGQLALNYFAASAAYTHLFQPNPA